jgi:hypothetical protein
MADVQPEDYGFRSQTEMEQYFSIDQVEVREVPVQMSQELREKLGGVFPFPNPILPGSMPTVSATPAPSPTPGTTPGTTPTVGGSTTVTTSTGPGATPYPTPYPTPYDSYNPFNPGSFPGSYPGSYGGSGGYSPTSGSMWDPFNIQSWITIGERLWKIVVDNQPQTNVVTKRVSVLPIAQQDWLQMENWHDPIVKSYEIVSKNLWGMHVVEFRYTVSYNYGGKFNGTGAFLANATVIPVRLSAIWGFKADVDGDAGEAVNMGTRDNPTAGVDIGVRWKFGSVLTKREGRDVFFLKGNGDMVRVTGRGQEPN